MTPEREKKIREVAAMRQPDLTVVFEDISDQHNIAAALRTCDAVGVSEVHIISTTPKNFSKFSSKSSASASKWITIHHHTKIEACVNELKQRGFTLYSTLLDGHSRDLYQLDLSNRIALVFGNEHEGVSRELAALCDGNFLIPQAGMIQSLNLSVACAVTLYEAFRQRRNKGLYPNSYPDFTQALLEKWRNNP